MMLRVWGQADEVYLVHLTRHNLLIFILERFHGNDSRLTGR